MVCVPGMKGSIQGLAGRYKADGLTETLVLQKFESADSLNDFIASNVHFFGHLFCFYFNIIFFTFANEVKLFRVPTLVRVKGNRQLSLKTKT